MALLWAASAQAASFDCAKAATAVEKMICADAELSKLDKEMASAHRRARERTADPAGFRAEQRNWLKFRNSCKDAVCVKQAYQKRLGALREGSLSDPPICSSQWFAELMDANVCGNPSSEKCYNMINAVREALDEQLKCATSKLGDHESFIQAHDAWKRYRDFECRALVPHCPYGRSGSCNMPLSICETRFNCKQIDHLRDVEHNSINSYNKR
jgi:uncharacterized protein